MGWKGGVEGRGGGGAVALLQPNHFGSDWNRFRRMSPVKCVNVQRAQPIVKKKEKEKKKKKPPFRVILPHVVWFVYLHVFSQVAQPLKYSCPARLWEEIFFY